MVNVPTKGDIDEMTRLNRILAGDLSVNTKPAPKMLENGEEAITLSNAPDAGAMAKIMESFASTTGVKSFKNLHDTGQNVVRQVVDKSSNNRQLKDALITTKTNDGLMIGVWKITKSLKEGLTKKQDVVYHIQNTGTGESVQAQFLVLEAAKAIVSLLSSGALMDHPQIREIAGLELEYRRLRERALHEKICWQRAKKADHKFKMSLYEAKFDAAKHKALYIKERIKNIYHKV